MTKLFPLGLVVGTAFAAPPVPLPPDMRTEAAIQRRVDAALLAAKEGRTSEAELQKVLEEADAALKAFEEMDPSVRPVELGRLETTGGKIYQSVTVVKILPDSLSIRHEAGSARIPFENVPEDVQSRFGYDPAMAREFREKQVERARLIAEARKRAADARADQQRAKTEQAMRDRTAKLDEREAELARREDELDKRNTTAAEPEKPLDEKVLKKDPLPGVHYPLPIHRAGLAFTPENGRKFVIPLQLVKYDNLRIRIAHGFDNSNDGGMRWELRNARNGKKLDAGFADEKGDYTVTVRNIPVRQVELVLTDDDTSFSGRDPGNGFSLSLSESG